MDGFFNINKPLGVTSSDIVVKIRRMLPKGAKVGHGGTLDPEASGVLPICVGAATRLFDYIIDKQKTYIAEMRLGITTTTQDATGDIVGESPVNISDNDIIAALTRFVGDIEQIPPMYSAVKKDGKRLYKLARKGEIIEMPARKCRVDDIKYLGNTGENLHRLRITCGKGVYIRTICHDIGAYLGCGAHMASLERAQAGAFTIENSITVEQISLGKLLPMDFPLGALPRVDIGAKYELAVRNGNPLRAEWLEAPAPDAPTRVYLGGKFAGIAQIDAEGLLRFKAMLLK